MKRGDCVWVIRNAGPFLAKIMAVADGYAMLRRPGCYPFIESLRELMEFQKHGEQFRKDEQAKKKEGS